MPRAIAIRFLVRLIILLFYVAPFKATFGETLWMRSFRVSFHNPRPPSVFSGDSSGKHSGRQASESNKGIKKAEPLANQEIPLERNFSKIILKFPKEFPKAAIK